MISDAAKEMNGQKHILAEEVKDAHTLNQEPDERPACQDEQHAAPKRRASSPLLPPCEEDERPLGAEKEGDADEEENVAHCQQSAVKKENEAEDEEEGTWRWNQAVSGRS